LIGTTSVKANPTADRPNRVSYWLDDPESIVAAAKLFDYVQLLSPDESSRKIKSAPDLDGDLSDLDDISSEQLVTLGTKKIKACEF